MEYNRSNNLSSFVNDPAEEYKILFMTVIDDFVIRIPFKKTVNKFGNS